MAARKRTSLSDNWKEKIQATQIMNRLLGHVEGTIELSATQVNAAKILLGKIIPDMKSTEHTGNKEAPIEVNNTVTLQGLSVEQLEALAKGSKK